MRRCAVLITLRHFFADGLLLARSAGGGRDGVHKQMSATDLYRSYIRKCSASVSMSASGATMVS